MKVPGYFHAALICLMLLVTATGCQSFKQSSGLLERQSATADLSSSELRPIIDDLVLHYASRVELSADQIIAQTDETEVHKNALLWKSNGISACFQAATRRDPLAAFLNIWILNKQSLELFQRTDSPPLFGDQQVVAIETTMQLEHSFDQILVQVGREIPIGEDFATRFAVDYPISNLYFDRASIAEHYTEYIEKISIGDKDLKDVVSGLDGQIDQFQKLSAMYAEFVPKQARWQAELLVLETIEGEAMRAVLNDINSATESISRVADVVDSIPSLVERERDILRTTVSEERIATLDSLQDIQADTMRQLEQERVAVLDELKRERATIIGELKQERIAATADVTNFGQQIVDQIDDSANSKIDTITQRGVFITDHFFKRAAQLGFVALVILLIGLWWYQRQRSAQPQRPDEIPVDHDSDPTPNETTARPHPGILEHRRAA